MDGVKLHGMVYAETAGGRWVRLSRGDAVADGHLIRTLRNGNAVFARGAETIALGPGTQAEIADRPGSRPFTTVREQTGTIGVTAEARAVRHFSVETPYLVAVVKGTRFTVSTDDRGSRVAVLRGLVAVTTRAGRRTVLLPAGQRVRATPYGAMLVSGTAVPALVHPRLDGVIEDAADAVAAPVAGPVATGFGAAVGGTVTGLGGATGAALAGATGTAGGPVEAAGTGLGALGSAAGPLGSTVGATGATVGSVGGAVAAVAGTAGSAVTGLTAAVGKTVTGPAQGRTASDAGAGTSGGLLHRLGL